MDTICYMGIINSKQVNNHLILNDPLKNTIIDYISRNEPKKLLDRARDTLRLIQYVNKTGRAYLNWIKQYILFHGKITLKVWA